MRQRCASLCLTVAILLLISTVNNAAVVRSSMGDAATEQSDATAELTPEAHNALVKLDGISSALLRSTMPILSLAFDRAADFLTGSGVFSLQNFNDSLSYHDKFPCSTSCDPKARCPAGEFGMLPYGRDNRFAQNTCPNCDGKGEAAAVYNDPSASFKFIRTVPAISNNLNPSGEQFSSVRFSGVFFPPRLQFSVTQIAQLGDQAVADATYERLKDDADLDKDELVFREFLYKVALRSTYLKHRSKCIAKMESSTNVLKSQFVQECKATMTNYLKSGQQGSCMNTVSRSCDIFNAYQRPFWRARANVTQSARQTRDALLTQQHRPCDLEIARLYDKYAAKTGLDRKVEGEFNTKCKATLHRFATTQLARQLQSCQDNANMFCEQFAFANLPKTTRKDRSARDDQFVRQKLLCDRDIFGLIDTTADRIDSVQTTELVECLAKVTKSTEQKLDQLKTADRAFRSNIALQKKKFEANQLDVKHLSAIAAKKATDDAGAQVAAASTAAKVTQDAAAAAQKACEEDDDCADGIDVDSDDDVDLLEISTGTATSTQTDAGIRSASGSSMGSRSAGGWSGMAHTRPSASNNFNNNRNLQMKAARMEFHQQLKQTPFVKSAIRAQTAQRSCSNPTLNFRKDSNGKELTQSLDYNDPYMMPIFKSCFDHACGARPYVGGTLKLIENSMRNAMLSAVTDSLSEANRVLAAYGSPLPIPFLMRLFVLALTGKDVAPSMQAFSLLETDSFVTSASAESASTPVMLEVGALGARVVSAPALGPNTAAVTQSIALLQIRAEETVCLNQQIGEWKSSSCKFLTGTCSVGKPTSCSFNAQCKGQGSMATCCFPQKKLTSGARLCTNFKSHMSVAK